MDSAKIKNNIFNQIPTVTLNNGYKIPAIGLGTFGSDNYNAMQIANAVDFAIRNGYRHIDCASVYMNEAEIDRKSVV